MQTHVFKKYKNYSRQRNVTIKKRTQHAIKKAQTYYARKVM